MISGIDLRRARVPRDAVLVGAAVLLALAVGRLLPGKLESLPPRTLTVLPLALGFVLVAAWLTIRRPLTAFVLAFALLGVVRVEPAPVDAVFGLLIAATLVTRSVRPRVPPFIGIAIAAFVVISILSMMNAVDLHRAVKFESITIYMLALAVWLSWAFLDRHWTHLAIKTYLIVAAASGLLGVAALYLPFPAKHLFLFDGARAKGLFKDPNVYSAFLVPAATIALEEFTTPRILTWRRRWIVGVFAASAIGVVVAFSRAAWLNLTVALVTLIVIQAARRRGVRVAMRSVLVLVACGFVGFVLLLETGSIAFLQERTHLQSYDSQRFSNQSSAFSEMTRHALGFGPGQAEVLLPISTHSSYVRTAYEQGLLGISLFILILAGTLVCALLLARRREDVNGVGTAALVAIWLGQMANSFFIDSIHWRHVWIFAGLIWAGYSLGREEREPVSRRRLSAL